MPTCFFSIVLPTKDRVLLLEPLIKSILDQDFKDFELIISDNSDTEETQDLLTRFQDKRINNTRTGGLKMADNWDQSIKLASGKYMLLFSDKMLIKKGALKYLHNYLENNPAECVTWDLDISCDKEKVFFKSSQLDHKSKINSKELIKKIILSDYHSYDVAPFHCNSCISVKLLNKIRSQSGRISHQLNPDYTFSYQVVLNVQEIHRLEKSLVILRQQDLETGYGNGFSQIKKTEAGDDFMKNNEDWVKRTGERIEIPVHGNKFIIDMMLKDLYEILKIFDVNPETYATLDERVISYYCRTLDEIYWRIKMGVNMNDEYACWKESLLNEKQPTQKKVNEYLISLRFQIIKIYLTNFIKSLPGISNVILAIRNYIKLRKGIKFQCLEELLEKIRV